MADLVVTGLGMRTAVGEHAVQTCASIRAGVNRFAEWPHFGATLDEDGTALVASGVRPDLGDGSWPGKAESLLTPALWEAVVDAGLFDLEAVRRDRGGLRVGVYLAVPWPGRPGTPPDAVQRFADAVGERIFARFDPVRADLFAMDQVGGAVALAEAAADLRESRVEVAVVGGVDSLLDPLYLGALHEEGRLKVPTSAAGLIPGEAAAFLVVETAAAARGRGASPRVGLGAFGLEGNDGAPPPEGPDRGRPDRWTRAVRAALGGGAGPGAIHRVIIDLNGERWRFREWALVETRCLAGLPGGWELWHPADCVGEVGAAFVPLSVGLAARAFARGHGGPGDMLICAAADRGERAALAVHPAATGSTNQGG